MDYVPAKILSKQASVYSPTSDAMSGYALAVRHDRLDYSVTKGGLRLWIVVIVFILLISGLVTVFSNKETDLETESGEIISSEETTSGELLLHEQELLERKIEEHKAKKRKKLEHDEEEHITSTEKSDEEVEPPSKPKIRTKHASEEEERRLKQLSEKAEAKRQELEKEKAQENDEDEEIEETPEQEEEEEEIVEEPEKEETEEVIEEAEKEESPPITKAPKKVKVEKVEVMEEAEKEETPIIKSPKKVKAEALGYFDRVRQSLAKMVAPKEEKEEEIKEKEEELTPGKRSKSVAKKEEPEAHIVEPPKKKEIKPVKVFKTKGKAIGERPVVEERHADEHEDEEDEVVEETKEDEDELIEPESEHKPKKSAKPSIPIKTFRTKGRTREEVDATSFNAHFDEEDDEEDEQFEEHEADEETCEAGAKCDDAKPTTVKKIRKDPIQIRYTRKKGRDPEDRFNSERHLTDSMADLDDEEEIEEKHEKPHKPLIPIKVFRTKGGAEPEPLVVKKFEERKKPTLPVKTFRTKGVTEEEIEVKHQEEKPKKPILPVKVFRTKGGDERKSFDAHDDESDEFDDFVAVKVEKRLQKAPPAYRKHAITNREDNKIRTRLDQADRLIEERELDTAMTTFDQILKTYPSSPRAHYGRARILELFSELKQSNSMLEESIREYELILDLNNVPDDLYVMASDRLVDRAKFRGWVKKALDVQRKLVDKFPDDLKMLNDYGVTFLIMGRNDDAKKVFETVLVKEPENGFALAHYGFILKTAEDKLEEAVDYLRRGITSGEHGTQDGRFFFQLGDALQRLNRSDEAYDIYEDGAQKGLFLSKLQRSLYNVEGLSARPWWTPEQTTYLNHLKAIENEWRTIKEEGVALLDQKNVIFKKEDERLTNKGDWRQFTLYLRGKKNEENCAKAPKTCALVEKFPEALGCTRGQIKFSVMEGGTRVWPHCGPTNCRLRGHLGLIVPPDPRIRVGNETKAWKRGKFIIFDDSFEHEVWYEGSGFRLVLIVDFWHPELTPQQRASLTPI